MKKLFPLAGLFIFVSFCLISCGRNDSNRKSIAFQTLEDRYPAWTNLTWVSTDRDTGAFPRMEIMIRENVAIIRQYTSDTQFVSKEYTTMFFLGNSLTFEDREKGRLTTFYRQTDSTVTIRTKGLLGENPERIHTYLMQKH